MYWSLVIRLVLLFVAIPFIIYLMAHVPLI